MLDNPAIFRRLSAPLQQRLAQLALLQQRAAVLARLPSLTKGKLMRWNTTPAPVLLKQVVLLATKKAYPKLSALLLRNWFQHKMDLCRTVRWALLDRNYLVPPLGLLPEPATFVIRLRPDDSGPQPDARFFHPGGAPLPDTDASPEEVTLMAELLGWCVRRPHHEELDPDDKLLDHLRFTYEGMERFDESLEHVLNELPARAPAAQLAARGIMPPAVDPGAERILNWAERYRLYVPIYNLLMDVAEQPPLAADAHMDRAALEQVVVRVEYVTHSMLFRAHSRAWILEAMREVQYIRHRSIPDFAPLAEVRANARQLTEQLATAEDVAGGPVPDIMMAMQPYLALLDWVHVPSRLDALEPEAELLQTLSTTIPAAVFNAMLLRKLEIGDEEPELPMPQP